jgi:hypothetical protein
VDDARPTPIHNKGHENLRPIPPGETRNPGGRPKGKEFRRWLRAFYEQPETRELLLAKIRRDLEGDGPGSFALKTLAYVYGEPKQTVEIDLRTEAERVALQTGVPVEEILATATQLAVGPN